MVAVAEYPFCASSGSAATIVASTFALRIVAGARSSSGPASTGASVATAAGAGLIDPLRCRRP
jgi:hypothetical protein